MYALLNIASRLKGAGVGEGGMHVQGVCQLCGNMK